MYCGHADQILVTRVRFLDLRNAVRGFLMLRVKCRNDLLVVKVDWESSLWWGHASWSFEILEIQIFEVFKYSQALICALCVLGPLMFSVLNPDWGNCHKLESWKSVLVLYLPCWSLDCGLNRSNHGVTYRKPIRLSKRGKWMRFSQTTELMNFNHILRSQLHRAKPLLIAPFV